MSLYNLRSGQSGRANELAYTASSISGNASTTSDERLLPDDAQHGPSDACTIDTDDGHAAHSSESETDNDSESVIQSDSDEDSDIEVESNKEGPWPAKKKQRVRLSSDDIQEAPKVSRRASGSLKVPANDAAQPSDESLHEVDQMVEDLFTRASLTRFCSIVDGWRESDPLPFAMDSFQRLKNYMSISTTTANLYREFLERFSLCRFAQLADNDTAPRAFRRGRTAELWKTETILRGSSSRSRQHKVAEARALNRVCAGFDGLLCFMPFRSIDGKKITVGNSYRSKFGVSKYQDLKRQRLAYFHERLSIRETHTRFFLEAGAYFEEALFTGSDVHFIWENRPTWKQDLKTLPLEELVQYLKPVQFFQQDAQEPEQLSDPPWFQGISFEHE
ncbi:hypothetical protein K461DRAFT_298136 [Myriangium duriaei CBS 260.36]|uniref:Uncharacterized protein n=1 Tax=Myriangium duriaei CBS 260.36 TaxID=1168546 RepID=A0A9P4MCN9_9PEZI|nr:hypothetical protein K461DRAFT_298136 [Myriangium duriaei CBS 260.36]